MRSPFQRFNSDTGLWEDMDAMPLTTQVYRDHEFEKGVIERAAAKPKKKIHRLSDLKKISNQIKKNQS